MTTVSQLVEQHLERDLVLNEALARGFLSVRKAARRLIEERGWDVSEEAVVSALRRYEPAPCADLENAFHLLGEARRTAETGLAFIEVPRAREYISQIPVLLDVLSAERTAGFVPHDDVLTILVDDRDLPEVLEALSFDRQKIHVRGRLGKVELTFPDRSPLNCAAIAVVLYHLGHHEIDVTNVYRSRRIFSVFVDEAQFADAFELVKELQQRETS